MGTVVGWIAVKDTPEKQVVEMLGLVATPDGRKATATICGIANGWVIVFTTDFGFPTPERMALVSGDGSAIAVSADDRTMFSVVRGYQRGKAVFAIEHDGGEQGARHIAVAGTAPPEWPPILDQANREQDEEDAGDAVTDFLFDAPMDLAEALCGYRHDAAWPPGQEPERRFFMERKKPAFLGRLFGKA
jgi:hypothetical protein